MQSFLSLFDIIFNGLYALISSYGVAIIFLSIVISIILNLLQTLIGRFLSRFNAKYSELFKSMEEIDRIGSSIEKHFYTKELYKIHGYSNVYKLFDILPVLVQIPFLLAAYVYLTGNRAMDGQSFLFIRDLALQDGLYYNINLLPLFMTVINLLSGMVYSRNEGRKSIQFLIVPLVFLFFLYDKPASILLYWTISNIISLGLNLYRAFRDHSLPKIRITFSELTLFASTNILLLASTVYWVLNRRGLSASLSVRLAQNWVDGLVFFVTLYVTALIILRRKRYGRLRFVSAFLLFVIILTMFSQFKGALIPGLSSLSTMKRHALYFFFYLLLLLDYLSVRISLRGLIKNLAGGIKFRYMIPVVLVPLYYIILNPSYFTLSSSAAFVLMLAAGPFVLYLILQTFFKDVISEGVIVSLCTILPVLFYLMPLVNQLVGIRAEENFLNLLMVLLITLGLSLYMAKKGRTALLSFFLSLIIVINISLSFMGTSSSEVKSEADDSSQVEKDLAAGSAIEDLPSIYLLIYDAYADTDMMDYYGIDNDRQFDYLKSRNFKFYDDVYTLNPASLGSIGKALNMTDEYYSDRECREIISGNSVVDNYLQSLGYRTSYVLKDYYVMGSHAFDADYIFPERRDNSDSINRMKGIVRSVVMGEFKFDDEVKLTDFTHEDWIAKKREIMAQEGSPNFLYTHTGPGHSQNSGQCLASEIDDYVDRLRESNVEMTEDIDTVLAHNPNSIIIIAGDHGPYLKGDCTSLRNYGEDEITGELIRDRYGMFLAIRWPEASPFSDYDIDVLQEVFIPILAYVGDNDDFMKYKLSESASDKYFTLPAKMVDSGRIGLGRDKGKAIGDVMY